MSFKSDEEGNVVIPGLANYTNMETIPNSVLLLSGPAGIGKTLYCRQFLLEGLAAGDYCIYLTSFTVRQFSNLFSSLGDSDVNFENLKLIRFSKSFFSTDNRENLNSKTSMAKNNSQKGTEINLSSNKSLSAIINDVYLYIQSKNPPIFGTERARLFDNRKKNDRFSNIRVVIDSLSNLIFMHGEKKVAGFVVQLYGLLKEMDAAAIMTLTTQSSLSKDDNSEKSKPIFDNLSSMLDGILEMRRRETNESFEREIRLLSLRGVKTSPVWTKFTISDDGKISFGNPNYLLRCTMCGKTISDKPLTYSEHVFDNELCLETYKKLSNVYGANISLVTGISSEVVTASFFFIDIVGLSDPGLATNKQIEKINVLNQIISSCTAFKTTSKDKKIVLPTGDGMAIGFFLNPELPLQLAVQLHKKLFSYNRTRSDGDRVGIRIGLSTGPVFIVNDVNDNQNVWGPGIIIARRVMDIGDNLHILLDGKLAEQLMEIKDEYKDSIKPIYRGFKIKHGQTIDVYSAYSDDFGNARLPLKISL